MRKGKVAEDDTPVLVREKLILLGVMNTLQPVRFAVLKAALSEAFSYAKLRQALTELRNDKAVAFLQDKTYFVTEKGRVAIGTGSLARERDRARMLYLVEKRKEGLH